MIDTPQIMLNLRTMLHAGVMKTNMQKKGLKAAKAKCPYCTGFWHARLQGKRDHMHMYCDGDCKTYLME